MKILQSFTKSTIFFWTFLISLPEISLASQAQSRARKSLDLTRDTIRIFVNDWVDKKKGNYDWKSKRFRRAMKLDAPHKSVSTHMAEIDKAICLMQFDARVDAFVPRVGDRVDAMRFFFWMGRKKKQTIPESTIAFQWPSVVDDEYKGLNGVQRRSW